MNFEKLDLTTPFINPAWYRSVLGKEYQGILVGSDGTIVIEEKTLRTPFPPGSSIYVRIGRDFLAVLQADYDAYLLELEPSSREKDEAYRAKLNAQRDSALEFNKVYQNLPFKWDVSYKDVLSGLSANSWGDGRKRNTVNHLMLLENYNSGKLARKKHDFLCSSSGPNGRADNGKDWSGVRTIPFRGRDGNGVEYQPELTCRQCIKIAYRILNTTTK